MLQSNIKLHQSLANSTFCVSFSCAPDKCAGPLCPPLSLPARLHPSRPDVRSGEAGHCTGVRRAQPPDESVKSWNRTSRFAFLSTRHAESGIWKMFPSVVLNLNWVLSSSIRSKWSHRPAPLILEHSLSLSVNDCQLNHFR
jgi:hypothetical protein